ncbi:MAG: phosphotransferase family protein, partial [Chloroflexota bacterium]
VIMELVGGAGLGEQRLDGAQVRALLAAIQEVYAITPDGVGQHVWPAVGTAAEMLARVQERAQRIQAAGLNGLHGEAHRIWMAWLSGPDPAILLEPAAPVFSRGDANLANCLWDGQRLRLVDFEYSGWSDRAFDLADLVEHVQSRGTTDDTLAWLVEQFGLSGRERARFNAARRFMALFWVMTWWERGQSAPGSPTHDRFAAQLQRARAICQGFSSER